jgi:hypothetical protein
MILAFPLNMCLTFPIFHDGPPCPSGLSSLEDRLSNLRLKRQSLFNSHPALSGWINYDLVVIRRLYNRGRSFRAFLTGWLIDDKGCGMPRLARLDTPGVLHHVMGRGICVCQEDSYLKELVRYIHLNLLRSGLVEDMKGLNRCR